LGDARAAQKKGAGSWGKLTGAKIQTTGGVETCDRDKASGVPTP